MRLSSLVSLCIVLVTAALMGVIGALSVDEERTTLQTILHKQSNDIAQFIAADNVEELISEDYPKLNSVLQTMGRENGNIMLIEISHDGRVIARYSNTSPDKALVFHADVMLHKTAMQEQKLGEVKLLVSERDNEAIIAARIKSLTIHLLLAFLLLSMVLRYLLRKLVVQRIEQLQLLIQQVIAADLPGQLCQHLAHNRSQNEIDRLRECFVSMLDGLQTRDRVRATMLAEIAAARTLLVDVTNAMHSALIVVARDGTITFCNRTAMATTENPTNLIVGKTLLTAFPYSEEDGKIILDAVRERHTVERLPIREFVDEQLRFFEVAVYPLSSAATGGAVIRIDDVTERVHFEEVMVQTDKMVSVGGLAAGIAHEINNPLGVMVQATQNIERRVSGSLEANHRVAAECGTTVGTIRAYLEKRNILEFLNDIKSDGARAAKIVQSLLEFSRRSESKRDLVLIEELFNQTIELAQKDYDLTKHIDFRQIKVVMEVDPALPPVPMVRSQIEQVLLNLFKNSAQALTEKIATAASENRTFTPQITLRARLDAGRARLEVKDNGPGFSAETRRRAFDPFFTTKPPGSGTGLGLWIAYVIVTDKHGGVITLDSVPGKGCTFVITLPLTPGETT